ncbi:MAG TPA: nucleotidyltransferase domain-containing protein [Frankiaceae bacterium]|nr:nucleotidyltransferase domain-containing protein [Frankiaceae bacterium]
MIPDLARHLAELVEVCQRFGVTRLDVFGSAVSGGFDSARSDVDFLVEFEPPAGMSRFDAYFGLKEAFEAILGRPVDLVVPSALANPYVADAVERTREPLYAA